MRQVRFAVGSLCVAFACGACGDEIIQEVAGSTVVTSDEPAGENCANGGVAFTTGVDADGDGTLSGDEVESVAFVCTPEEVTVPEVPAVTLTSVADEPAGDNCPNGGVRVDTGLDADADGALSADEVTETTYTCFPEEQPGTVLREDTYVGNATPECPGGFVVSSIGLDANNDGTLQPEEQTVSVTSCNYAPAFASDRIRLDSCDVDNTLDFGALDPEGELALVTVETLSSGATSTLSRLDDLTWTLPAGEHRGGMRLLVTASDAYGAEVSQRLTVTFDGEGCIPLETFYGVDPDSCREINVDNLAGDDRGGVVLSASYAFYNGDSGLVRTDRALRDITRVSPENIDTLVSDGDTFELYTLWSSEFEYTNVLDAAAELEDAFGEFDQLVPVDEETFEIGTPINLAVPLVTNSVTTTVDLPTDSADIVADFSIEGPLTFDSERAFVAVRGGVFVLGMRGPQSFSVGGEKGEPLAQYIMYFVMDLADGALLSAYVTRDLDNPDFDLRVWQRQEVDIARLPLVKAEGEDAIVFRDDDEAWLAANVATGELTLLTPTYAAACDSDHLALDFDTGRAYGHSESGCFGTDFEETMHVCDMLLTSNIEGDIDDQGFSD